MCRAATDGPVIPVARFRPFGRRQDGSATREPDPWLDDPPPRPVGTSVPATRAATPAMWAPRPVEPAREELPPVTDPFGFPPVPPVPAVQPEPVADRDAVSGGRDAAPAWAAWVPDRPSRTAESPWAGGPADTAARGDAAADPAEPDGSDPELRTEVRSEASRWEPVRPAPGPVEADRVSAPPDPAPPHPGPSAPDPAEAAALAGAFAADYLSWDEDDPARRGRALSDHLPGPGSGHALLGWSGAGRQRADLVLPGAVRPDGDGRLLVDVRVRVTPYRRVSRSEPTPEPDPRDALGTPAAAPSVTARGWRGLAARWVRLGVTVVQDGDRLVVDAGEETFDAPDQQRPPVPPPPRPVPGAEDPTLDGDDVVAAGSGR